jgi:hypothetical protein
MNKNKKCECCNKDIEGNLKLCNSCSLYVKDLKRKFYYYKRRCEQLCVILSGQKRICERVRL